MFHSLLPTIIAVSFLDTKVSFVHTLIKLLSDNLYSRGANNRYFEIIKSIAMPSPRRDLFLAYDQLHVYIYIVERIYGKLNYRWMIHELFSSIVITTPRVVI